MRVSDAPGYRAAFLFFILTLAAFLAVAVVFWNVAPPRVPSHYNAAGDIDDWSSKAGLVVSLVPGGVAIPVLFAIPWP